MELFVPSVESVRGPAIKIALPVRPRLGGASPILSEDGKWSNFQKNVVFSIPEQGKMLRNQAIINNKVSWCRYV
jgi:hypothetical protein